MKKADIKAAKKLAKQQRRQERRSFETAKHPTKKSLPGPSNPAPLAHASPPPTKKPVLTVSKKSQLGAANFGDLPSLPSSAVPRERLRTEFSIPKRVLDDICARFPLNFGNETVSENEALHLLFVVEECYWFYLDYSCRDNASLQPVEFEAFARQVFERYSKLARFVPNFSALCRSWSSYKRKIPVHGAILIDSSLEWLVLVRQQGSRSWFFPKGKINEGESASDCAVREVLEECGIDCAALIDAAEYIFIPTSSTYPPQAVAPAEQEQPDGNVDRSRLFLIAGVPRDAPLVTRTRNEIAQIQWFHLDELRRALDERKSEFLRAITLLAQIEQFIARKRQLGAAHAIASRVKQQIQSSCTVAKCISGNGTLDRTSEDAKPGAATANITLNEYEEMELQSYTLLYRETMEQKSSRPATLPSPKAVRLGMLRNKAAALTAAGAKSTASSLPTSACTNMLQGNQPAHLHLTSLPQSSPSPQPKTINGFTAPSWRTPTLDTMRILDAFKADGQVREHT